MPAELRPQNKRKSQAKPNRIKRIKAIPSEEVEKKIKILEQKEKEAKEGDDKSVKADNESDEEFDNVSHKMRIIKMKCKLCVILRKWKKLIRRWMMRTIMETIISITEKDLIMMKMTI